MRCAVLEGGYLKPEVYGSCWNGAGRGLLSETDQVYRSIAVLVTQSPHLSVPLVRR